MLQSRRSLLAVLFAVLVLCLVIAEASPHRNGNNGNGNNANNILSGNSRDGGNNGGGGGNNGGGGGNNGGGGGNNGGGGGNNGGGGGNNGGGGGNNGGGGGNNGGGGGNNGGGNNGGGGGNNGQQQTAQQKANQKPGGISTAADGSTTTLDKTVTINGLPIRFKVSAPADQFTLASGVEGAQAAPNTAGSIGMNVLLHGDGGQSFFDFPNQGVNSNLMGVAVLAPDKDLKWGSGNRNGVERPNGVAHSQAVNDLIKQELPQMVAFNQSNVFFTGVSGGSLTLSGFFMPAFLGNYPNAGVLLSCGALVPQVDFTDESKAALSNTRIHFQSTQKELGSLQKDIPAAIKAYEQEALDQRLDVGQINALQTVDNTPNAGHCAFDNKKFVSGVQTMANSFADIMLNGGNGELQGTGNVLNGVVGNEDLKFGEPERK